MTWGHSIFPVRRMEAAAHGRLRGIGFACYIEICAGGEVETATVHVAAMVAALSASASRAPGRAMKLPLPR